MELAAVGEDVIVPAATAYDGEWVITFVVDDDTPARCGCFADSFVPLTIEDGYGVVSGTDCATGLAGFPADGQAVTVEWRRALQNFVITDRE